MKSLQIRIIDKDGLVKAEAVGEEQSVLIYNGVYEKGDKIAVTLPKAMEFYVIRIDDTLEEAYVFMKDKEWVYTIPFEEKKTSYNPKAFSGDLHYLTCRKAKEYEINGYKNLALNVVDQHEDTGCYPHAFANVETRGEAVFAVRNAIDGVIANTYHGSWPFASWGINRQDDAELVIDFGRAVDIDRIVLYTRADFPHDNWWTQATFEFSDHSSEAVKMEKSAKPHEFFIVRKGIERIKLCNLIKSEHPSPFPALTQIEVYGNEAEQ
ncbi:discoidin/SUN/FTP domain-containing protein [Konateibacter massiliensis]|uniref:carbohydrate-binding protein n=1 Tax=Konateibacter massiliensis TaxID=2002841 RepID=UPI000C14ACD2|nr:carbohydrate-binding protein [Konateibacter massiliensis]